MTKLRLASAARPALMLVVEGPPWTSSALVSGPNSQNCAREVRLAVVLSYRSLSLVLFKIEDRALRQTDEIPFKFCNKKHTHTKKMACIFLTGL